MPIRSSRSGPNDNDDINNNNNNSAAMLKLKGGHKERHLLHMSEQRLYDIVKSGSMTKRSQNKKRFTPVNYKQRWFELTKHWLTYFDVENVEVSAGLGDR